jgi:hypothetical protein
MLTVLLLTGGNASVGGATLGVARLKRKNPEELRDFERERSKERSRERSRERERERESVCVCAGGGCVWVERVVWDGGQVS